MTSATFDPRGFDAEPEILEPERVSILAILGLVFGLICFIPILPLLGVICAISGLIAINRSRGRLAGTGMAFAGLILGLAFTALQGALALGAVKMLSMFSSKMIEPAGALVAAIDAEDYAKVRQEMVPTSQPLATDDAFKAFRDGYRGELGAFKGVPKSYADIFMAYQELGPQFQAMSGMQGRNDILPVPAVFEKGAGLLIMAFDPAATKAKNDIKFQYKNISLILPSKKVINLIDEKQFPPPIVTSIPSPGAAPTSPDTQAPEPPKPPDAKPGGEGQSDKSGG